MVVKYAWGPNTTVICRFNAHLLYADAELSGAYSRTMLQYTASDRSFFDCPHVQHQRPSTVHWVLELSEVILKHVQTSNAHARRPESQTRPQSVFFSAQSKIQCTGSLCYLPVSATLSRMFLRAYVRYIKKNSTPPSDRLHV